ncbi:hypothetical protein M433DRAFT_105869 [Acidomyces richmondensis BFW]|nr:MAG: hypothetical protein FE78DRAFT_163151 [Acidomyces sp. 'richmondensis']KYG46678.1 hypothetical protein M433DRAFT_105869 [Acidomyces richmondensis BFW]
MATPPFQDFNEEKHETYSNQTSSKQKTTTPLSTAQADLRPQCLSDKTEDTDYAFPFSYSLPGPPGVWDDCPLGWPDSWSDALKTYTTTIADLTYPAAIFWNDEFVIFHNYAWSVAGGIGIQGQSYRNNLNTNVCSGLDAVIHGGKPMRIDSKFLLAGFDAERDYIVLISPLFDVATAVDGSANGALAQLLPKPAIQTAQPDHEQKRCRTVVSRSTHGDEKGGHGSPNANKFKDSVDNVPLNEHPFFRRFAEMIPSGLAILDHKAQAVFVNQHFYELTTHQGEDKSFKSWPQSIHPDDYERVMSAYHDAFSSQTQLRIEFRALGQHHPWRLLLLTPLGDENLKHVSLREYGGFICSVVDITSEKSAELAERKAAKEARERKEQQERFIDMISHEIRNPLSAVLHCSENIEDAIQNPEKVDVSSIREAVSLINLCIQHQKNIVDDVLAFSKLDASMLSLVPKPSQPQRTLANSLKMFQPEFRKQGIEFGYTIDSSYKKFNIEWVMADLSRISQILINLVSNAIKFTARAKGRKKIDVCIGVTNERPTSWPPKVVFFNSDDLAYRMDGTNGSEWGNGEPLYVMVAVQDTGIGISEEGQKRLFERFRQATPKTEEIYGGSGLGLNISRKLCHLHGGEIGVKAKMGIGSTFSFFFKVRRTDHLADRNDRLEESNIDHDLLKTQVEDLGNTSPNEMQPELMVPASLEKPPVQQTELSSPFEENSSDDLYQNTAGIASNIEEGDRDLYAASEGSKAIHDSSTEDIRLHSEDLMSLNRTEEHKRASHSQKHIRAHVLLVEDNIINQRVVLKKLENKGFKVTTANNGQEAVEELKKAPKPSSGDKGGFDVVLMDQEMPVMDGNAATRALREMERNGELDHIPIIGVTANVRGVQQDEMMESGMDVVISKPYRIEELVMKIEDVVENLRMV